MHGAKPMNPQMNPDEIVTITNNKTKQIKQVKRTQLPEFGLPVDYISQADTYAKSVEKGLAQVDQVPEPYRAGAMQSLNARGFTPKTEIERKIDDTRLKAKGDAQAVFSGIQNLKKQAQDATIGTAIQSKLTGGNLGTETDVFDQSKKLLGQTIANLYEKGRLSDADRTFYQNEILKVDPIGTTTSINKKLDNLSTEILRKAGYTPEDFAKTGAIKEEPKKKAPKGILPRLEEGAKRDVMEMGQGILDTGMSVARGEKGLGVMDVMGNLATDAARGIVKQAGQAAPIRMENGQPKFDPQKTADYVIDNPLDTALAVAPFVKLPKIGGAAKAVESAEEASAVTGKLPNIKSKVAKLGDEIGVNAFSSNFTIPSKIAPRIKIDEVSKDMIRNGHSGTLPELAQVADQVTGQNGLFPKLNREALSQIKTPIKYDEAIVNAGKTLDDIPELTPAERSTHRSVINKIFKPGNSPGETGSLDAFDAIQQLEKRGYQYKGGSTDLTPNIKNEQIGQAYINAADELKDALDKTYKDADVLTNLKTADNIAKIEAISPQLARDFVNAKTMADLRKLQSPYVRLKQAIDLTGNASNTAFSKMSGDIGRTLGTTAGAGIGGMMGGPVGGVAGAAIGTAVQPFLEPVIKGVLPPITTGVSKLLKRVKK